MSADQLHGRVCVVTGASSGIGLETAAALAGLGATVCLVCRSAERGRAAQAEILRRFPDAELDLRLADLSDQTSIRALSDQLHVTYPAIHLLINNAGLVEKHKQSSVDGVELQFAVNHLAPFLLTTLVTDLLTAAAPARVVNLTSGVHGMAKLDPEDVADPRKYDAFKAYAASKLAVVSFTKELAERLRGKGVTVNSIEPGLTRTPLMDNARVGMFRVVGWFLRFAPTAAESAAHIVHLATDPEFADVTGAYYRKGKPAKPAAATEDPAARERLWVLSERLTTKSASPSHRAT
jgi:NAD(P)-dependent dehydrogenase (short-subunit alcohol dehydrogenase family)